MRLDYFARNVGSIVVKNLKILLRARASALIVILGPLLIILIAGLAFDNTNTYAVKIGAFSSRFNDLSNGFVDALSQNQFKITKYYDEDLCIEGIKKGDIHTCVVFSSDFTIAKNNSNEIKFFVDYSKINLVWTVLNVLNQRVSGKGMELSKNLTNILLTALDYANFELRKDRPTIVSLTTSNEDMRQKYETINAELAELELGMHTEEFGVDSLQSKKQRIKQWVENYKEIAQNALEESKKFVSNSYSVAQGINADVGESYKKSLLDIEALIQRVSTTNTLVDTDFGDFTKQLETIAQQLANLQNKFDAIANARNISTTNMKYVGDSLEKALIYILDIQRSFNNIQNKIDSIEITDPEAIVQPVNTVIKPVVAQQSYLNYIFPILMVLVIMFTALFITPTLILVEKNSPAYIRNFMTPTSNFTQMFSTFVSAFALMIGQLVIVILIAAIFFSAQVLSSLHLTLIVLLFLIAIFTCMGMIIGYLFNTEETASMAAVSLGSLLLFLSDVILPKESMPNILQTLTGLNPFVLGGDLLRRTIIFNADIRNIFADTMILVLYLIITCLAIWAVYVNTKKHYIGKYVQPAVIRGTKLLGEKATKAYSKTKETLKKTREQIKKIKNMRVRVEIKKGKGKKK